MDVNVSREKKLTNMRAAAADATVVLVPPRQLSLEQALEHIAGDECVEVTPTVVRLRKVVLSATERGRLAKRAKNAARV
jgi:GTP-binding protein